jgi:hypothetical protein
MLTAIMLLVSIFATINIVNAVKVEKDNKTYFELVKEWSDNLSKKTFYKDWKIYYKIGTGSTSLKEERRQYFSCIMSQSEADPHIALCSLVYRPSFEGLTIKDNPNRLSCSGNLWKTDSDNRGYRLVVTTTNGESNPIKFPNKDTGSDVFRYNGEYY